MKRVLSLFLSCLLMLTALGSCAEKTLLDPNDPVTLTMWHVYGEQADAPMNLLIHAFNETVGREKGINITVTNVSSSSKINGQLYDSFDKKPGSLEMPDLFSCHTTTAMTLGAENLVDFNRYFSRKELSKYVPAFLEDGIMDDKLVVFPVSKSTYALYVNGSQFERFSNETGVDYDSLSTWKGLFEAAEE
ncbi:MAG: carbohydrate ABC transporter substrate-binding protein, partial [Clostridia bacterium]|nr:carbohydrate ABC transporter substrate-binding protein [Clostridia bacterium]